MALEEFLPPGRIDPVLRGVAADRRTHPLVAAQVEYQLALAEARAGDFAGAERRFDGLGLFEPPHIVGPFDAQGRGAISRVLPPEEPGGGPGQPRAARAFRREGARGAVALQRGSGARAAGARRVGALALDGLMRPDSDAVAYALTYLRSDRPRQVVLRLGSAGPVKVWLAGRPIFERNVVREPALRSGRGGGCSCPRAKAHCW